MSLYFNMSNRLECFGRQRDIVYENAEAPISARTICAAKTHVGFRSEDVGDVLGIEFFDSESTRRPDSPRFGIDALVGIRKLVPDFVRSGSIMPFAFAISRQ